MSNNKQWNALVELLKERMPPKRRIVVRRIPMQDYGSTSLNTLETVITVCIRAADSLTVQMETLIHEWGHVLEYDRYGNHSDRWGKGHAEAYSVYLAWMAKPA